MRPGSESLIGERMRARAAFPVQEVFVFGCAVAATQWALAVASVPLASALDAEGAAYRFGLTWALFPHFGVLSIALCLTGLVTSARLWFRREKPRAARVRHTVLVWALLSPALLYVNPSVALDLLPLPGLVSYRALTPPPAPDPNTWAAFRHLRRGDSRETMLARLGPPPAKAVALPSETGALLWVNDGEADGTGWRWGVRAHPDGTIMETFLRFWFD